MELIAELRAVLGDDAVLTEEEAARRATSWIDPTPLQARVLLRPRDTAQVAAVLRLCHAARQPVVTYGGGTNLVEATHSTPGDIVLSLERMAAIEAVDTAGHTITVGAGTPLQRVQEAAAAAGLLFPLDLAARGSATVGGCAAMNAGGVRVLRYGVMRDLILGIEAVLADGTVISAMNRMLKNNAGYDLKQLFIGSEGTLGVITRLVLRLYPAPSSTETALLAAETFTQVVDLLRLLKRDLGGSLSSFEVMWPAYYCLTTTPPASSTPPLPHGHGYYILIEAHGSDARRDHDNFAAAVEHAFDAGLLADGIVAANAQKRAALWRIREDSEQIERQHHLTFGFDVSLPAAEMEVYVAAVRAGLARHLGDDAICWIYGHLADGNLHIDVWSPALRLEERETVEAVVYGPLGRAGGSISAEHGIGLEKKRYLGWSRSEPEIALMRHLKRTLDPYNILNPGKVIDQAPSAPSSEQGH